MLTTMLRAETPGPADDVWYGPIRAEASSGVKVTAAVALRLNVFMACVRVIAESLASLPWILYRERPGGGKDRAKDHPLYSVFNRQPNPWQTRFEFVEMLQGHCSFRGNAFARIVPTGRGAADLIPLHPDRMKVEQLTNHRLRYWWRPDVGEPIPMDQDEIFHVRGLSLGGLMGIDPTDYGSETIGTAIAGELYAGRFWKNDATPAGLLTTPQKLNDKTFSHIRESFNEYRGINQHKPRVLEQDLKWQQLGINAEEAQVLESRKFSVEEICRMMRVPLHMVQSLDHATNNNIEHQGIGFVVHTIRPWAVRWELAADRDLIDEEFLFTEFLLDALQRGDTTSRFAAYSTAISARFMSPNEARAKENLNPYEGGDTFENPNTTPGGGFGGGEQKEEEDDEEEAATLSPILSTWITDLSDRITRTEIREIGRRVEQFDGKGEKFSDWLFDYYRGRMSFTQSTLEPFREACEQDGLAFDVQATVNGYATSRCQGVDGFEEWASARAGQVAELIRENIK